MNSMQADFRNQAMLRQHEEGPAHKKALARAQAERERNAWVTNPSAASNALVILPVFFDTLHFATARAKQYMMPSCFTMRKDCRLHGMGIMIKGIVFFCISCD